MEKMEMEIMQLQHIKYRLMSRKKQLLDETENTQTKTLIEDMETDTKKIYDKVFPLRSEIHNLELRSLELKEQIQLLNMENEANILLSALKGQSHRRKDVLSRWFQELDQMASAGSAVNNPRHQTQILKSDAKKEKLEFTVLHRGICVMVQIFIIKQSQEQNPSSDNCVESVEVCSDIFIPDLLQTVKYHMFEKNSASTLIAHITQYITDEIVPHIFKIPSKENEISKSPTT